MSLGVVIKSAEGVVLAADSRVTIFGQRPSPDPTKQVIFPVTFDNATKLINVQTQSHVGAVTYGAGVLGMQQPRTAASYMPEFEQEVGGARLSTLDFATRLGDFFTRQWHSAGMNPAPALNENMIFLVGGYDEGEPYGRVFTLTVPGNPVPQELLPGDFGGQWGGQTELVNRIVLGFDDQLPGIAQGILGTNSPLPPGFADTLKTQTQLAIPWAFLPLQDCVNLAVFMVATTIAMQQWMVTLRGVGGAVDIATITRTDGFKPIRVKKITATE